MRRAVAAWKALHGQWSSLPALHHKGRMTQRDEREGRVVALRWSAVIMVIDAPQWGHAETLCPRLTLRAPVITPATQKPTDAAAPIHTGGGGVV